MSLVRLWGLRPGKTFRTMYFPNSERGGKESGGIAYRRKLSGLGFCGERRPVFSGLVAGKPPLFCFPGKSSRTETGWPFFRNFFRVKFAIA